MSVSENTESTTATATAFMAACVKGLITEREAILEIMTRFPELIPVELLKIQLSDEDVENLLDCAGYGIGYWADTAIIDTATQTYTVHEGAAEPSGDKPVVKTVSYDEVRVAFNQLAGRAMLPEFQMREIADNDLSFDATVGDLVVQWLLFGEIVYG